MQKLSVMEDAFSQVIRWNGTYGFDDSADRHDTLDQGKQIPNMMAETTLSISMYESLIVNATPYE